MKILLKIIGGIIVVLILAVIVLRITGLNPNERRAGLWLTGTVVTTPVTDWSFTDKYPTIEVQTNTPFLLPHSVTTNVVTYNGDLYLNSRVPKGVPAYPLGKLWNRDVARDPHVRLKIGDQLYDRTLVFVTDPAQADAIMAATKKKYPKFGLTPGGSINFFRVTND